MNHSFGDTLDMTCALCLKNKPLCKSHIIPDFMYRKMFDDGAKAHVLSTDEAQHPQRKPTGIYEKLLCASCESTLSGWETYARGILYGDEGFYGQWIPLGLGIQGLDYARFKLFQLSLLWRAGASTRYEFRNSRLDDRHAERLRLMLLASEPGEPCEFGCMIFAVPSLLSQFEDFVQMPEVLQTEIGNYVRFVMGGLFWLFAIPTASREAEANRFVINHQGELHVVLNNVHGSEYFHRLSLDLHNRGNLKRIKA